MSRAKHTESLHAVQLFPFVAVLLCTMGSLLVLLVSVARSSKDRGAVEAVAAQAEVRAAAAARAAELKENNETARRELEKISKFRSEIDSVRTQAAGQLRQDQLRLSHLEDHMRRLREQLEALQLAAAELNALDGQHVDDRKLAQAEIERLQGLIEDTRKEIEQLRATAERAKSYAIVPYQGRRGTYRRPIYIECRKDEITLQPEGVVFTVDDFQSPIGPGNALAAALRAAREHIVQFESNTVSGTTSVPYPLIIVRPDGIENYYRVREAIQSWDDEFGYELVEQDWELKYTPANPQLANKEYQAAELARGRLRALAAAAPQAYGAYRSGGRFGSGADEPDVEDIEDADEFADGEGAAADPTEITGQVRVAERIPYRALQHRDPVQIPQPRAGSGDGASGGSGGTTGVSAGPIAQPRPATLQSATSGQLERKSDGAPADGAYVAGDDAEVELNERARDAAADEDDEIKRRPKQKVRGKNWALANEKPGMIPIRRTIQIVVRQDALAILPELSSTEDPFAAGQEFAFGDAPEVAYESLILSVENRITSWGMAGQGLYWRPVAEIKLGPSGEPRLDDLMRLLKFSGVEVRSSEIAQRPEEGAGHANR